MEELEVEEKPLFKDEQDDKKTRSIFYRGNYKKSLEEYNEEEIKEIKRKLELRCGTEEKINQSLRLFLETGILIRNVYNQKDRHGRKNLFTQGLYENYNHPDIQVLINYPIPILTAVLACVINKIIKG